MTAYELRISDWSSDVCSSDLLLTPRIAGARGAQADSLPARPRRRRQILACGAAEGADGGEPHLCAEGGRRGQPRVRKPALAVRPRRDGRTAGGRLWHPAPPPERAGQPLVPNAAGRVRRRPLALFGGADESFEIGRASGRERVG